MLEFRYNEVSSFPPVPDDDRNQQKHEKNNHAVEDVGINEVHFKESLSTFGCRFWRVLNMPDQSVSEKRGQFAAKLLEIANQRNVLIKSIDWREEETQVLPS